MPTTKLDTLIDRLREAELLEAAQFQSLVNDLASQHQDPESLARQLVVNNWLSSYQAGQLLEHDGKDLVVGRYLLLEVLGEGGMGKVFKARAKKGSGVVSASAGGAQPISIAETTPDPFFALKVIRQQHLAEDVEAVQRFQREARAAAQLTHPNIVAVRDFGQDDDTYFMAMEYLYGIDLHTLVQTQGPLPIAQACDFIRQAALGLQHAHEHGMVHRDIKPSNLMACWTSPAPEPPRSGAELMSGGRETMHVLPGSETPPPSASRQTAIKILDMGLVRLARAENSAASLTQDGAILGTPDFISPEQALNAHRVDIRADLYSLGGAFYYILTGSPPFPDGTHLEKLLRHQLDEPRPVEQLRPQVGPEVAGVVRKLLAKRPMDRFQTPGEVVQALVPLSAPDFNRGMSAGLVETIPVNKQVTPATPGGSPALLAASVFHWAGLEAEAPTGQARKAKKIAVCEGHQSCVTCVALAPDGMTMASGDVDGILRMWEFSGKRPPPRTVLRIHSRGIHALAYSPDNCKLAVGSGSIDGLLWLGQLNEAAPGTLSTVTILDGQQGSVEALAFSADGQLLACGGSDKTVRVWDCSGADCRSRAVLKGHTGFVRGLAFAANQQTLASAGADGSVRLWSLGRLWSSEQAVLLGHAGPVNAVAFTPDGRTLASAGQDRTVRLWDLTATPPREKCLFEGHGNVVRSLQFPPDGQRLVSAGDGRQVIEWSTATGEKINDWLLAEPLVTSFGFSPDGRYVASGISNGPVVVYRLVESKRR
jgi:WD40 repeat protein/serine/threonine protein kinase